MRTERADQRQVRTSISERGKQQMANFEEQNKISKEQPQSHQRHGSQQLTITDGIK
jgi:hypothetical protein